MLVRDKAKAEQVSNAYPQVRVVLGELDSAALLEEEARKADVVVREWSHYINYRCCLSLIS